jgi:hypothetical protein
LATICPTTKYDLATIFMHEIAHGLGISSAFFSADGSSVITPGYLYIYDSFLSNSGVLLSSLASGSSSLTSNCTNNNVRWNGANGIAGNGGSMPSIYSPTAFTNSSSLSHLDELTYTGTTPNSLMTPTANYAERIHDCGQIINGMLNDIGWGNVIPLITGGLDNPCYISFPEFAIGTPLSYNTGTNYNVSIIGSCGGTFKFHALYEGGEIELNNVSLYYNNPINFTLSPLPSGYTYLRNANGTVKGRITYEMGEISGKIYRFVEIKKAPDKPSIQILPSIAGDPCNSIRLMISSKGATSLKVSLDVNSGIPYLGSRNFTQPNNVTYLITDVYNTYGSALRYFAAQGINSFGTSAFSDEKNKLFNCPSTSGGSGGAKLINTSNSLAEANIYPNPFVDIVNIECQKTFNQINIIDINGKIILFKNYDDILFLSIHELENLETGIYLITIKHTDGTQSTIKASKI